MKILLLCLLSTSVYATTLSSLVDDKSKSTIVADKTSGRLYVWIASTRSVISNPALFGKTISDVYNVDAYNKGGNPGNITPAGNFRTTKYYSQVLQEPITAFIEGNESVVAIHPVPVESGEQQRLERLESPSSRDNRITNGCINVTPEFYREVIDRLNSGSHLVVLPEGDTLIDDITFASLPTAE